MERHRQDRADAYAGRHAADIGPGMVRLCRDAVRQPGADRNGLQACTAWLWAARPWERASTRRPALPKPRPPRSPGSLASPSVTAPNKFTVQGAHDALVQLSGTLRTLAVSLYKIGNDIRLMSCGPRAGFAELEIPENEPAPRSCRARSIRPVRGAHDDRRAGDGRDVAVGFGGAGGYLEMNVYKPLMIFNVTHSITIMSDGCENFRKFLVEGTKPNLKKINEYVERSLMLVTALSPSSGTTRHPRSLTTRWTTISRSRPQR